VFKHLEVVALVLYGKEISTKDYKCIRYFPQHSLIHHAHSMWHHRTRRRHCRKYCIRLNHSTSDHIRPHRTTPSTSDPIWAPGPQNDPIRLIDIHSQLKNVCVLITQTHSQSPCDLTDPRGGQFFKNWLKPVLLTITDPRGRQFRGLGAQFKFDEVQHGLML